METRSKVLPNSKKKIHIHSSIQYVIRVSVLHPLCTTHGELMGPAHQLNMSKDQDALLQARNRGSSINMKQPSAPITACTKSNENKILFHVKCSCMRHILKTLHESLYQSIRFRCYFNVEIKLSSI